MYIGDIVEYTDVYTLFSNPLHPYTIGLSKSIPRMNVDVENLDAISGIASNLHDFTSGCPFHPRCSFCFERCVEEIPEPRAVDNSHLVKCHLVKKKSRN